MADWYRVSFGDARARTRRPQSVSYDALTDEGALERTPRALVAQSHEDEVLTRVALG
jgi:hypothetical protein